MPQPEPKIRLDRLKSLLEGVNGFGFDPVTGGYNRPGFSQADIDCRVWFADEMRKDKLNVWTDGALNVFGRFGPADGPAIMAGSHLDTVVNGGAFDGALGVCVALECVRTMKDAGINLKTAIEVVATSEEEGRFGGMLGSQAIAGAITEDWIDRAVDADGQRLCDVMARQGLDPLSIMTAARPEGSIGAFLELHIEQGPILERKKIPIGIADQVSGVCYLEFTLTGAANHSGTTPMSMRADAFAGLAELAQSIPTLIKDKGTDQSRVTIGHVALEPNQPHTIPGRTCFSVILRDTCEDIMLSLKEHFLNHATAIACRHDLQLESVERSWLPPTHLDASLAGRLQDLADRYDLAAMRLPSGAGHDAQTMQTVCPSGLIFVPSKNGISHSPDEHSDWQEIEKGANLMLRALIDLSGSANFVDFHRDLTR